MSFPTKNIFQDTENKYPKLLVLSNNSLSENNSNGRTLAGFLQGWKKDCIAQIYTSGETPESKVCDNFYRIMDKEVLKCLFQKNSIGKKVTNSKNKTPVSNNSSKIVKKTIFTIVLRDILWGTNVWWNKGLKEWLCDFSPDVLLFFAGESIFTYKMAIKISRFCDIPIVVYNSEGYYFKEKNYLKNSGVISEILYPLFHKNFQRVFKKLMKRAYHTVYINDKLKNDYNEELGLPSTTIYTASNVIPKTKSEMNEIPRISYLGNLGIGRHIPLCEIAEALYEINKDYKLDIYGKIPNDDVKKAFDECSSVNYCGVVPYSEVVDIMHKSDLLVHGEAFSDFTRWDLKYAFTTKIADSLSSGTCFFVYAPEDLACSEYLIENKSAVVVTDKSKLKEALEEVLTNDKIRNEYIKKGIEIAELNHNSKKNCEKFQSILFEAVKNEGNAD